MALPVVTVASGGLPVTQLSGAGGLPVTESTMGGLAVTKVASGGLGATFITEAGVIVPPFTPFTPLNLGAALKSWYSFDTLAGADGTPIDTLVDGSGNGITLTQTGILRATKAAAHQNSKHTAKFTAANNQRYPFPSNYYSGASAGSVYIVVRINADPPASGNTTGIWSFGTSGQNDAFPWTDGNIYCGWGSTVRKTVGNPTVSMATYRIYHVYSALNDWGFYIDGGAGGSTGGTSPFFSTATNTVGFDSTPWIGISDDFAAVLDGWIAEMAFTTAKQSTTDRQKMEGYLAHKWGLTGNLSTSHPYKSTPPGA